MDIEKLYAIIDTQARIKGEFVTFTLPECTFWGDMDFNTGDLLIALYCIGDMYFYTAVTPGPLKAATYVIYNIKDWIKDRIHYIRQSIFQPCENAAIKGVGQMFAGA